MDEKLAPYTEPFIIELLQEDKTIFIYSLPPIAGQDATYLKTWLHKKALKTQMAYLTDISRFYLFVNKPLQGVTLLDFQDFTDTLLDLKPASRKRITASVKSALSFGQKMGYLVFNVGSAVKLPKLENKLAERILSEQEIARMFALETQARNHAILILLYRAGLRVEELCNLRWRHFQERDEAGQLAVFGKGRKTRHVLLDQATWDEILQLHCEDDGFEGYIFKSRQQSKRKREDSNRLDPSSVHRIVKHAAQRAGVKLEKEESLVSPHYMRHSHATHAIERGAPLPLVSETLGHESMQTTSKYIHVRPGTSSTQYLGI